MRSSALSVAELETEELTSIVLSTAKQDTFMRKPHLKKETSGNIAYSNHAGQRQNFFHWMIIGM